MWNLHIEQSLSQTFRSPQTIAITVTIIDSFIQSNLETFNNKKTTVLKKCG